MPFVAATEAEVLGDLAQLEEFSQGDLPESAPIANFFLGAATAAVRNYCGWHVFPAKSETMVLDGPGGELLELRTKRLQNVKSLTENGVGLIPDVDFEWSPSGLLRKRCWTERFRSIVVEVEHGFTSAPDLLELVYGLATRAASSPSGAVQDTAGPFTVTSAQVAPGVAGGIALMAHEKAVLDPYRLADAP